MKYKVDFNFKLRDDENTKFCCTKINANNAFQALNKAKISLQKYYNGKAIIITHIDEVSLIIKK